MYFSSSDKKSSFSEIYDNQKTICANSSGSIDVIIGFQTQIGFQSIFSSIF
jgi:hypothetical protein